MNVLSTTIKQAFVLSATEMADGFEMPVEWEVLLDGQPVTNNFFRRSDDDMTEQEQKFLEAMHEESGAMLAAHTGSSEASTPVSDNGRSEALGLLVETRDWFRERVTEGIGAWQDECVTELRKLDRALSLLTEEA